jgi:hypothetical protein
MRRARPQSELLRVWALWRHMEPSSLKIFSDEKHHLLKKAAEAVKKH